MVKMTFRLYAYLMGTLRSYVEVLPRRLEFLLLYYTSADKIHRVHPLIVHIYDRCVDVMPISGITFSTTKSPGYETLPEDGQGPICWEAPVAITVYSAGQPMFGVGIEFVGDILYVRQLQGVRGARFDTHARFWPRLIIEAAKDFVREHGLQAVRMRRASESLFFKYPEYPHDMSPHDRAVWKEEHQKRMRRRYDGTARQAGFVMKDRYGEWENNDYARSY